jgi:hypothetical protein
MSSNKRFTIEEPTQYTQPARLNNFYGIEYNMGHKIDSDVQHQSFYTSYPKLRHDLKLHQGELPVSTTPKLYRNIQDRLIPEETFNEWSCIREDQSKSIPFQRSPWSIFDNIPIQAQPQPDITMKNPSYNASFTRYFASPKNVNSF